MVLRPRLIERLSVGLRQDAGCKLTLVSAPAGFGKTTLVGAWVEECERAAAWLTLDAGDSDLTRFLSHLIAAIQTIASTVGADALDALRSPQPPSIEAILSALLNDIAGLPTAVVLVLDDYHALNSPLVDRALTFLLEHVPPQLHVVITTREDPCLPLSRLRARGELIELRAADLRFTSTEAAGFLNQAMGLTLAPDAIAALTVRTEGWIAGLQLAAISMQGHQDTAHFIAGFSGSHHFVMDYLLAEVLQQQPEHVQTFLLRTAILDRLCGPLCDAVLLEQVPHGQETLEYLERVNLFIVPLDNERRWYRYHQLFAELLRQRLARSLVSEPGEAQDSVRTLHRRASQWYEDNGLAMDAFHHAAAANDIDCAHRLIESGEIPLHIRGAVTAILNWLGALPTPELDARPALWWRYAALLLVNGQTTGVAEKLQAAEDALAVAAPDAATSHLAGHIAAARATLALTRYDVATMLEQSHRALAHLPTTTPLLRANAHWTLGYAYFLQGDRAAARSALTEAIVLSQEVGAIFTTILATVGLGNVLETENQLHQAAATYRRVLELAGDQPLQIIYEAHLGLARVLYEWNDLAGAEVHGRQSIDLARQYDHVIDRFITCEVFLSRVLLARGDLAGAAALISQVHETTRQRTFLHRIPEVVAAKVLVLLRQDNPAAAAALAEAHRLPHSLARVRLAQGDPAAALAALEPLRQQAEARGWQDERLKVLVLMAVAHQALGAQARAAQALDGALALAAPGGFIRIFVDEGPSMAQLLAGAAARGRMPDYVVQLLVCAADVPPASPAQPLIEPLSPRELQVLRLIAQGLSNQEIGARLSLALDTVKGHNRRIFEKLQVQRRTEAVARARDLGML